MMSGYPWSQIGQFILHGLLLLVSNPLFYVGGLLAIWEVYRNGNAERRFFGIRATKSWRPFLIRGLSAIVAGLILSAVCIASGVVVSVLQVWVVTGLCIVLAVIRVRLLAAVYAIELLCAAAVLAPWVAPRLTASAAWLRDGEKWLLQFPVASWLALACVICLAEAALLWIHRRDTPAPAVVMGRRGRVVGAFVTQLTFMMPVFLVVPGALAVPAWVPASWPWLGALSGSAGLVGLPILAGYSGLFATRRTSEGVRVAAFSSLSQALLFGGAAAVAHFYSTGYAVLIALLSLAVREIAVWYLRHGETHRDPIYVPSSDGVRILAVVHGSLADTMDLVPGEVITHVNQVPVHSPYDLHFAFDQNPAYAKLQVLDLRGELRIVGKPVYMGERHHLGLILTPEHCDSAYRSYAGGLLQTLYLRLSNTEHLEDTRRQDVPGNTQAF